ncbi:MAG: glycosyltransferase family 1 protein [Lachnospiraceae bacterium]|nr:glycosyltransferase family 1 protein [Lachnospiraceae bacterium]
MQHVYICGAKSLAAYGGFETFVYKLTEYHQHHKNIKYHIACKANGSGCMDENKLAGVRKINDLEFEFHNAHCFKISVPDIGSAVAIYYDIQALKFCCRHIRENKIGHPVVYILACRIGPFMRHFQREIHRLGGRVYVNPDGHEFQRACWRKVIRWYWKKSEQLMVKHADLLVCDSLNIQKYIEKEYRQYKPKTTFIAYGSDTAISSLADNDMKFTNWLEEKGVSVNQYYMCCGRFVPENSFEIMIREFMQSSSVKDFVIITTDNKKFLEELNRKLGFKKDKRIKFAGTVYDQELLKKIRENAYGYFHGHTVGGTNPSLLEALGSTKLNLLVDVGFNREVAGDAALYWSKEDGSLAELIDKADKMNNNKIEEYGRKAEQRIKKNYSWELIAGKYEKIFCVKKR